ncbi:sortase [Lacticaseibacillus sharpeae JCM 1186 = DSM 20505]|uniref:Sortase n=1 Tax=Lacticaseibacillus sharpeae JCM 1186 = DSM 20505 TaxID=1291052 RepID=A0A0R1ZLQ5_9LACO|nr:sortase [Lacticaseibacillus sharpeae JCM 1186 = DSM 20505]
MEADILSKKQSTSHAKKNKKRLGLLDILIVLWILIGLGVVAYPFVSDAWVSYQNQQVIDRYQAYETKKNAKALKKEYDGYVAHNKQMAKEGMTPGVSSFNKAVSDRGNDKVTAKRNQKQLTNATIAQITIPKIAVSLPVFNHTTDWLLQFGSCLLDGTSYPTGGKSTHAVISAHRGVPNATLFTNLPRLKNGDKFFIKIGNKTLAYKVYKRQVVEPTNTEVLKIQPGKDIVTLMTCTPYMINSHRLLITGKRVPYTKADAQASKWAELLNKLKLLAWILAGIALIFLLARLIRGLMIAHGRYQLDYIVQNAAGEPVPGAEIMVRKRGLRRKLVATLTADETGHVEHELPGDHYRLLSKNADVKRAKAYVKKWRDKNFTVKLHK